MDKNCSSLRESLLGVFANELEVTSVENGCIVTLPLKTVDDRYIDVCVERIPGSSFVYVHDGGKSTAELFIQGVHPTETQEALFKGIARSHGAIYQDGRFHIACPNEAVVQSAIMAIAQCASLAMIEVVSHQPKIEEESVTVRVARALHQWQPDYMEIHRRYYVKGKIGGEHAFDFVAMSNTTEARTVALKILPPSVGPIWQAQRFGFMVYDIQGTQAADWPRLAIVSKIDEWPDKALDVVKSLTDDVILLETDHEERVETILPRKMTELTKAA